ncbi:MAG: hypothetical protein IH946_01330 [Bacteroidetes bacterium]|nr:hypothetical protein [Bacteroidota bacterium]
MNTRTLFLLVFSATIIWACGTQENKETDTDTDQTDGTQTGVWEAQFTTTIDTKNDYF